MAESLSCEAFESLPNDNDPLSLEDKIIVLMNENDSLRTKIAALELKVEEINQIWKYISEQRHRISVLEQRPPSKLELSRAEKIEMYLKSRQDHKADFDTLRGYLGVDKNRLKEAIKQLMNAYPEGYKIIQHKTGDKRQKTLVMIPIIQ